MASENVCQTEQAKTILLYKAPMDGEDGFITLERVSTKTGAREGMRLSLEELKALGPAAGALASTLSSADVQSVDVSTPFPSTFRASPTPGNSRSSGAQTRLL